MMSYDNYHFTTKVTTMHNADYELVGDNRNILLGGGCMVHFPTGHKFAGQWVVAKVNSKSCIIVSKVDENGKPLRRVGLAGHDLLARFVQIYMCVALARLDRRLRHLTPFAA